MYKVGDKVYYIGYKTEYYNKEFIIESISENKSKTIYFLSIDDEDFIPVYKNSIITLNELRNKKLDQILNVFSRR